MKRTIISIILMVAVIFSICTAMAEEDTEEYIYKLVTVSSGLYGPHDTEILLTHPVYETIVLQDESITDETGTLIIESLDPGAVSFALSTQPGEEPEYVSSIEEGPDKNGEIRADITISFLGEHIITAKTEDGTEICRWTVKAQSLTESDIRFQDGFVMEKIWLEVSKEHHHSYRESIVARTETMGRYIVHTCMTCEFVYRSDY